MNAPSPSVSAALRRSGSQEGEWGFRLSAWDWGQLTVMECGADAVLARLEKVPGAGAGALV